MAESKDIKYINRDFDSFRNNLIEFSKHIFLPLIMILVRIPPGLYLLKWHPM